MGSSAEKQGESAPRGAGASARSTNSPDSGALDALLPEVLQTIQQTLIRQETAYQNRPGGAESASLWAHSSRVGRIAHHLAKAEGLDAEPALLAGLLHDIGKFADGAYHENEVAEEQTALRFTAAILTDTPYAKWIPGINEGILSLYREDASASDIGRVVYDADRLDKLGHLGVAQFFAKNTLRGRFLDNDLMTFVAQQLKLPPSRVFGVVTFYHFFNLKPKGAHSCVVCMGTACYVKGADKVVAALEGCAKIKAGETTPDGKVSLGMARCIGACGIAPAVVYDGAVTAKQTPESSLAVVKGWLEHGS